MRFEKVVARLMVSSSLIIIIILTVILKYPFNLIIDALFLALVGITGLIYILIWTFLEDKVKIHQDYLSIFSHKFPFWNIEMKKIYFKEIKYYVISENEIIFNLIWDKIIHVEISRKGNGVSMRDLYGILHAKKIKKIDYEDFIKKHVKKRNNYFEKI